MYQGSSQGHDGGGGINGDLGKQREMLATMGKGTKMVDGRVSEKDDGNG